MAAPPRTVYGNTDKQILKQLKTFKAFTEDDPGKFEIIDTVYIEDTKIVGFMSESYHGIAIYEKDYKDNYVYKSLNAFGRNADPGLALHRSFYSHYSNFRDIAYWIVFSYWTTASKIELTINDTYVLSSDLDLDKPSIVLIPENIPPEEAKSIGIKYKYYDSENIEHDLS